MLQVSAVVPPSDLQSYVVVVGAEPNLTYMSASPVPPELTNFRPVAPEGTARVKVCSLAAAPAMPVLATPLVSTVVGGGVVPLTASSTALALRMPVPIGCDGVDGNAVTSPLIR